MYDRLNGSTTMIMSSAGTTVPGAPVRPEYLKASVYLPPTFVAHHPDLHRPILGIVQMFIETVGVRTVNMWAQRAHRDLGYALTQPGNPRRNPVFNAIPSPQHNSAHYTFLGQPSPVEEDVSDHPVQVPNPAHSDGSDHYQEEPDSTGMIIIELQQENSDLQEQVRILRQTIANLEEQVRVTNLRNSSQYIQWQRDQDRIADLEAQVHV